MLNPSTTTRLLAAIDEGTLVFLCGAGLSMAPPSRLPSAVQISQECFDKWQTIDPGIDVALRTDLEGFAAYLHEQGYLSRFVNIVPWARFRGQWNDGHAAIGDLLSCRAAFAALSANFDTMIERWADFNRGDLGGFLTGEEAMRAANSSSGTGPLLKFHGCESAPTSTIWTERQLSDPVVKLRLESCRNWMDLALPDTDIVVVGFWSDWTYLNELLVSSLSKVNARSVLIIDPASSSTLRDKAPELWRVITELSSVVEHVQASGAAVLDFIRAEYSRAWLRRFYQLGHPPPAFDSRVSAVTTADLYDLRRDAEGVSRAGVATRRQPEASAAQAAIFQASLLQSGASRDGSFLLYNGFRIRVVNGGGRILNEVQEAFREPPAALGPDMVVCVGAEDLGVPAVLVRTGSGMSAVRPAPGGAVPWYTLDQARLELGL